MKMTDQKMKDEMRYDMLMEAREESMTEKKMYEDVDFCIEQFESDISEAVSILEQVQKNIYEYGHEITMSDIIDGCI